MRHSATPIAPAEPALASAETLIGLLAANAARKGRAVAVRERKRGIWVERTWSDLAAETAQCAAGLTALGVAAGDAITFVGDNRAALYVGMLASMAVGAFPSPSFPDLPPNELAAYMEHGQPDAAFAEDQEQVDKLLEVRRLIGRPRLIIHEETRGITDYADPGLMSYADLLALGRRQAADDLGAMAAGLGGGDVCALFHSSGTTGKPKGIAYRHAEVIATVRAAEANGTFRRGEITFAYLPIGWAGDFVFTLCSAIVLDGIINIPERQETVAQDIVAVAPSSYLASARSWDALLTRIKVGIADSSPVKRAIFDYFIGQGLRVQRGRMAGKAPTLADRALTRLGEWMVYGPLKDRFGLSRATRAFTAGEALGEDTFLFFRALGVPLCQMYGQTETCGMTAAQDPGATQIHTVGRPFPGTELRIAESGEVQVRSQGHVQGYYRNDKATAEAFLEGGWFCTGDAGHVEPDGQLVILGRVGDVVRTASGERLVPTFVENRLKSNLHIRNAAVIGADRPFPVAIVCIDQEAVGFWAEGNGVSFASYADLSQHPRVGALIAATIAELNATLPPHLRVRRFVNLHKDFDADDGEITRTRKLRRGVVESRYAPLIAALYEDPPPASVNFDAEVTYDSGKKGTIRRSLTIREVV